MLPSIIAQTPLYEVTDQLLRDKVNVLSWHDVVGMDQQSDVVGLYIAGHLHVDGPVMDRFPNLKVISNCGVGVDHINVADATARSIPVGNTPGVLNGGTADMAFALLLAGGRRLAEGDRFTRSGQFAGNETAVPFGQEIHGSTIGIVGLGRIGFEIAKRALGFEMRILYHNRNPRPELADQVNATYCSLELLLSESDYVVIVCPLSPATRGLIGAAELKRMKPTAVLVNIARGGIVDTDALTKAMRQNEIFAAALDVTDPEPLPADHPLLKCENVTITPHVGSATFQTRRAMVELAVENLLLGIRNEPLKCQVN